MFRVFNNYNYNGCVLNLKEAKERGAKSNSSLYVWMKIMDEEGSVCWKLLCKDKEGVNQTMKYKHILNFYSADV